MGDSKSGFFRTPPDVYKWPVPGDASDALRLSVEGFSPQCGLCRQPEGFIPGLWAKRAPMPRASSQVNPKEL